MFEIYEKLIKEKGITTYKLCQDTGIPPSTFSDWKKGKSKPKLEKMQKIANYLGVSVEYLNGNEENAIEDYDPTNYLPEDVRATTRQLLKLSKENFKVASEIINFLSEKGDEAKNK